MSISENEQAVRLYLFPNRGIGQVFEDDEQAWFELSLLLFVGTSRRSTPSLSREIIQKFAFMLERK